MVTLNQHVAKHLSVLSLDLVLGTDISAADRSENTQKLQHYATDGWSLYFPPGEYEFNDEIVFNSHTAIKVWGDNARLYQRSSAPRRLLSFDLCDNVAVGGLHLHGEYFVSRAARSEASAESLIYAKRCRNVRVTDNVCEGFNCWAMAFEGGYNLTITGNQFRDGHWTNVAGQINTGDIRIEPVTGEPIWRGREIIITGNQCNTESLVGIFSQYPTRKIICTGNSVVTKDKDDNELTDYAIEMPKAGIELQYYTDFAQGNDNEDSSQYEMVIADNHVSGVRYSGISFQSSAFPNDNPGGVRGTVTGNLLRYCGLEQAPSTTERLHGGIVVNQYRDIVIANNVVKNVPNTSQAGTNTEGSAGILVMNTNQLSKDPGGVLCSATVTGNIITDCQGRGIKIHEAGDVVVTGNICRDVLGQNLRVFDPGTTRGGKTIVNGNKFVSTLAVADDILRIEGINSNYIISDNDFDFSGAFSGGVGLMQLYNTDMTVIGNRLRGSGGSSIGLKLMSTQDVRFEAGVLSGNHFDNFGVAVQGQASANRGPWIMGNTSFRNCAELIRAADASAIFAGQWADGKVVAYGSGPPTQGNWLAGDMILNNNITAPGQPQGWVCTTPGTPGTFVFTQFGTT